jgi:exosortase
MNITIQRVPRNVCFLFFNIIAAIIYFVPLKDLLLSSFHNELYSHIILIPLVSGYLIFAMRNKIFSETSYSLKYGMALVLAGIILYLIASTQGLTLNQNDLLSLVTFSTVIFWIGGFILFYGIKAFKMAAFPLLFLLLMIPFPSLVVEKIILFLQSASAEISYVFFRLTGVPVYRDGFLFHLPGISVEVAKQCSGIRSSLALFITSILAGYLFLHTGWKKGVFTLSIIPIAIIKNGVRIVTLSLLGAYVDRGFLTNSFLHNNGGILFFILGLILLTPILWLLRRSEGSYSKSGLRSESLE